MRNSLSKTPPNFSPMCQRLSTLILRHNPLKTISDSFFVNMVCLRVLDLSYTDIEILPNSISNLKNITALLLKQCTKLKCVPCLAKLAARIKDIGPCSY
ncbi:hypothetical protein L1049_000768 [Liquidambar formosana]|uniref:Uncharacterized protein n=1 Tax=Liquidambar formosana TaxID=63359 RepID=A0AAP0NC22_LIQFO